MAPLVTTRTTTINKILEGMASVDGPSSILFIVVVRVVTRFIVEKTLAILITEDPLLLKNNKFIVVVRVVEMALD